MQPDNEQVEKFLSDETFRDWVRTGGLRHPDTYWSRYWHDHPAQQPTMREAQNLLLAAHLPDETVSPERTEQFVAQTLTQIRPLGRVRSLWTWPVVAAATLTLALGLSWWRMQSGTPNRVSRPLETGIDVPNERPRETRNNTSTRQRLTLADGSTVLLQPGATLRYPIRFGGRNREVALTGEAFFRVTKRPDQPFLVLANGMVTKVLGTSFRIRANDADPTVTLEVKTGRVAVFAQTDLDQVRQSPGLSAPSLLVTPNQQVVFERKTGQMNRSLVDEPALLTIPEQNRDFVFTDAPIAQVFSTLETAYGVDIVYDSDALQRCTLTAPLGNEPLFDKLTIICRAIGGRYEVVGAQVVIQAEGCAE
ncbi:FecR family protein [Spirosoma montaniterrae]|uniref:Iron dicitrate transport regulator FecR n=1 Tax=Spirosoma montaniterrae TaxID=1178516 RepID=A0A1P9WUK0_9BACT|nr:FecR family protein [Spirosoma montaniterrae]AQG79057.1 hypothetical protein AWR27_06800 [Spirosoma montaniterrae]